MFYKTQARLGTNQITTCAGQQADQTSQERKRSITEDDPGAPPAKKTAVEDDDEEPPTKKCNVENDVISSEEVENGNGVA